MTERDAFLDAIADAPPDDDGPRLVYADWLEEHREPARAELIRVECAMRRLPAHAPDRRGLHRRAIALIEAHKDEWGAGLIRNLGVRWWTDRGLIDRLSGPLEAVAAHAEALLGLGPVTRVDLEHGGTIVAEPTVQRRARRLPTPSHLLAQLAECPYVSRLAHFGGRVAWSSEAIIALAGGGHWQRLRVLDLRGEPGLTTQISTRAAAALVGADLPRLETLNLVGQRVHPPAAAALRRSFGDRVLL